MKRIVLTNILIALLFSACIDEPQIKKNNNQGNYDALWEIVDTKYCYLGYKEIDWQTIYHKYLDDLKLVKENDELKLFELFSTMLEELKDGHVNLYSSFNTSRYWKWYTDYPSNFNSSIIYNEKYLGDDYKIAGGMRYKKIAEERIGYVYYGSFSSTFSDSNIYYIFKEFKDCEGLIIDLRNNGGGYLSLAESLASHFFKEKTHTGFIAHKTGNGHDDFSTPQKTYTNAHKTISWNRTVVILTNRMSYSATNDFVCRIKQAEQSVVIGDKTGGGGGMPLSSELPNGWLIRFSACPMYDIDLHHTEWGIEPDMYVSLDENDDENDAIIDAGVEYILK